MLRTARSAASIVLLAGLAAACATEPPSSGSTRVAGKGGYRIGVPYQIGDTWYYPHEQADYDETGVASWYGPTFYGKPTANGEIYDGEGLTAAHRTLPLPVNVRVTNLDNGKSLVVRVNDRGPFAQGRIIDVSKHAAELLGFYAKGTARVRVTYLGRADRRDGAPATDDLSSALASNVRAARTRRVPEATLKASSKPVRVASVALPPAASQETLEDDSEGGLSDVPAEKFANAQATHLYIQAGTFRSRDNAERLKARLLDAGGVFVSPVEREGEPLYRVRSGPYDDLESANAALARLGDLGNNGAQIVVDQ